MEVWDHPSPALTLAVDVLYERVSSATLPGNVAPANFNGSTNVGVITNIANEGNLMARFRVHKDFYP